MRIPVRNLLDPRHGAAGVALLAAIAASASHATAASAAARPPRDAVTCQLSPMIPGWLNEGIPTDFEVFLEPDRALKAVMLFVDFPDAPIAATDPEWQSVDSYVELHQPGAEWLRSASYGAVDIAITPVDAWYRMGHPSTTYGLDRAATFEEHVAYLGEAVALADSDVDFSEYDIVYVVTGPNATGISNSPAYIDASDSRILADGTTIRHAATFGTDVWGWAEPYQHLVLAHETGHVFGLPDLYSYAGDTYGFVGGWDVMADIDGPGPGLFAWHRWKLGWIPDRQVACLAEPGVYTVRLTAVDRASGTKLAAIPTSPTSAIIIESRRAVGLDAGACSTGVLMYRVDSAVPTGSGPIRVVDATPGDTGSSVCGDLDIATFGLGSRPSVFIDPTAGVRIEVERQARFRDVVTVTVGG